MLKGKRIRENVYILGAGFSVGVGYPMTKELLYLVWKKLSNEKRNNLEKVIKFHFPCFENSNEATFPNIENLLTLIKVNEELFDASRESEGNFSREDLKKVRESLLREIYDWFHELYEESKNSQWMEKFVQVVRKQNAGIISFNWDLLVDHKLFSKETLSMGYGLKGNLMHGGNTPILLKPHGSLNWYEENQIKNITVDKRINIFSRSKSGNNVDAFLYPRGITSRIGKNYTPLIIPPTYLKDFSRPIFQSLWKRSTDLLSTAKNIYILGYSLPKDDLQARFILRCGFHNQIEGRQKIRGGRHGPTGAANVFVVNPSMEVEERYLDVIGPNINTRFIKQTVEEWVESIGSE